MEFVRLGWSGLKITKVTFGSALTIGTERNDEGYSNQMIKTAWELGIRSFDTSNNYGYGEAEKLISKALLKYPREEYVLATKGSWPIGSSPYHKGLSRKHILWAFEESIKNMGIDYIDIYYAHRYDPEVSMEEIVRTFNYLISTGRVRYWATSEWLASTIEECIKVCDKLGMEKPILEQFIYSYAIKKAEFNGVKLLCESNGMGTMGFSPLCQGYLTGKYRNGIPKDSRIAKMKKIQYTKTANLYIQNKANIDFFLDACDKYNVPYSAAALQWCIRKKIYPVLGASKPEQLIENINGLDVKISFKFWEALEKFSEQNAEIK